MTWFISNHCINWKLKQDGIFKFCLMKMCIDFPKTRLIKVYCPTNDFRGNMTWKSCIINKMHIINKFSTLVLLTLTLVSSADAVNPVYNFYPTTSCFLSLSLGKDIENTQWVRYHRKSREIFLSFIAVFYKAPTTWCMEKSFLKISFSYIF